MTLQNKKTHLLDNENDAGSDVVDLFDQYGGGDDTAQTQISPIVTESQTSMRPQTDDEVHPIEVSESETEKKWEQKYEEESPKKQIPAQEVQQKELKPEQSQIVTPEPEQSEVIISKPKKDIAPIVQPIKASKKQIPAKQDSAMATGVRSVPIQQKKSMRPKSDTPLRKINIDHSKKTIMIVDDDIDTLAMYTDVFESANYNVISASDGLEAMSFVAEHTPHVIFTGIIMPRMDGFSMMEALKQNKRTANIPVVINSHLGRDVDKSKAEELGARDFIVRGFTQPREVVERVGALLLRSDYIFRFDKADKDAQKLAKDLGASNFFHCPQGQEMVLKLNISDEKNLTFAARFSCVDIPKDKK